MKYFQLWSHLTNGSTWSLPSFHENPETISSHFIQLKPFKRYEFVRKNVYKLDRYFVLKNITKVSERHIWLSLSESIIT